jgi:hypothetical protein
MKKIFIYRHHHMHIDKEIRKSDGVRHEPCSFKFMFINTDELKFYQYIFIKKILN